nr:anoctamin-8-like isoform X3 [Manis javanica]
MLLRAGSPRPPSPRSAAIPERAEGRRRAGKGGAGREERGGRRRWGRRRRRRGSRCRRNGKFDKSLPRPEEEGAGSNGGPAPPRPVPRRDAPGEPDGRAAKRRSWLGCVGGGTTRAHLLAAARARKGDRDLTLTARETQPWGMKRFLRTRKRSFVGSVPIAQHNGGTQKALNDRMDTFLGGRFRNAKFSC